VPSASRPSTSTPTGSATTAPPAPVAAPIRSSAPAFGPQLANQRGRAVPLANAGAVPPVSVRVPAAPRFGPNTRLPQTGAPVVTLLPVGLLLMALGSMAVIGGAKRGRQARS
jgi:hypothetical protein